MVISLQQLKDEFVNDPLARGYTGMTDTEVATSLSTKNIAVDKTFMSASEIFEAIDVAEFTGLSDVAKAKVNAVLNLGDNIKISTGSKARAFLVDAFAGAGGATTRAALLAASQEQISRAYQLFGGEIPGIFGWQDAVALVAAARALP